MSNSETKETSKKEKGKKKLIKAKQKASEYIDYQVKAFRFALFLLGTILTNSEVKSLQDDGPFNFSRFAFIIVICVLLYFTVFLEDKEGQKKQARDLSKKKDSLAIDLQGQSFTYLIETLVHEAKTVSEKIEIVKIVPNIVNLMSIEDVQKSMSTGFQGLVETLSIYVHEFNKKGNEIKDAIDEKLEEVGLKKKRKKVKLDELGPPSPKTKESLSDEGLKKLLND